MNRMDYFFRPKSIAVIGASRSTNKIGNVVFRNFIESKFKGKLYPINPTTEDLMGFKCYPTIAKVPGPVDLAIIVVPSAITIKALEECGKKGVKSVIIITSGFKEIGNHDAENKIKEIVKKYGMKCIGPNCLGVFDAESNVDTFFLPRYKLQRPKAGNISFISQSGALGSVIMDWMAMKNYKISKFISYGNAADIDEADLINYLSEDKSTKVICAYLEGVVEGRKFYDAIKKTTPKKPVIVLKGGTTEQGTSATMSHTGSLAGEARIFEAAIKQAGGIFVENMEEMFDYARVLSIESRPNGNRVQVITNGGGYGVLATDNIIKNNLTLAKMNPKTIEQMRKTMPEYVVLKNPMDLTGDTDAERYKVAMEAAIDDNGVDIIVVISLFQVPALSPDVVTYISEANEKKKKPIIVISGGGNYVEVLKKSLEDLGIPTFSYPQEAIKAVAALAKYGR